MNTAILIPSYEPDEKLLKLVRELTAYSFPYIIVVDDGSSKRCSDIFNEIDSCPNCKVLHHIINKGKGAALKTEMQAILYTDTDISGCITVDADGQHLPEDILKVAKSFNNNCSSLILGCRDFSTSNVPFKSKFGNIITRTVYKLTAGKPITDTQTGLRAIPFSALENFLDFPGDHYEFEMNML